MPKSKTPGSEPDPRLDFLSDLNPEQYAAATYTGGPLLILAGAGSGKTRCLTYRFAYLVRRFDLSPGDVLAITFTNKAAREMRQRIERLLADDRSTTGTPAGRRTASRAAATPGELWISTFHSACARLLRRYGSRVGLEPNFVIYDSEDQVALMKRVVADLGWNEKRWPARGLLAGVGRAKDELVGPEELAARAADFHDERLARAYLAYQNRLAENNAADFDDLIFKTVALLREDPEVLARLRARFRHVLIDEYQDTNHAQYVFANLLAAEHRNLCVVGDDDQSIYRWRGADIRNVLEFEEDYADARVIRLERNYRSTKTILKAANGVIAHNTQRKGKTLWTENDSGDPVIYYLAEDEREEAEFVAGEVLGGRKSRDLPLRSFAVLYRTHAQSRAFEDVFMRRAIPYQVIGGLRFYERKEIKDVLAYLRAAHNPADEVSLERALGVPKRGIGPASLARLREVGAGAGGGLYAGLQAVAAGEVELSGVGLKARTEVKGFIRLLESLRAAAAGGSSTTEPVSSVADMVREVAEQSGLIDALRLEGTPEAQDRIANIMELATVAADYARNSDDPSLASFLETAALLADIDVMKEGDDGVVLMTVHNAKGLEFPHVFVVGLEQGLFPHQRSFDEPGGPEEERRLCYVAMTRAERRLYLTHARRRTLYGYGQLTEPSMFLEEVPKDALFVASLTADIAVAGTDGIGEAKRPPEPAGSPKPSRNGAATAGSRPPAVFPGEKVVHPEWGQGIVVGLDRRGGEPLVKVAFAGLGIKTLPAGEVKRRER